MGKAKFVEWRKVAPSPLILVFGSEEYIYGATIRRLRDQVRKVNPGVEIYEVEASEYVAGDLENMASPSLFSDPKLILIQAVEKATDDLIEDGKNFDFSTLVDTNVVFQHSGTSTRGKALLDAIRGNDLAVEITCSKVSKDNEKTAFVQAHFLDAGRKVTQSAVRALVDAFGNNILELAASCDQLLADSAEQIDEELVDRYFGGRLEADAFKIFDAAVSGKAGEAILLFRHSREVGVDLVYMLGGLASKVRQLVTIYGQPNATAQTLGMHPYSFSQVRKSLAGWNDEGLANALRAVADADAAAKGAERQPEYRVEQLLLLIANRGRA
jgi:DNA polymerase-3 subunit delta